MNEWQVPAAFSEDGGEYRSLSHSLSRLFVPRRLITQTGVQKDQ
jgi:hypothetical protein